MKATIPILLRAPKAEDINFIYSSWLKSYRNSEDASRMSNEVYYGHHKKVIEQLLQTSNAVIACNPADPDQVYGYTIFQVVNGVMVIHYTYTKFTFRKLGIAKEMIHANFPTLGTEPIVVTHANRVFDNVKEKYLLVYNPYIR